MCHMYRRPSQILPCIFFKICEDRLSKSILAAWALFDTLLLVPADFWLVEKPELLCIINKITNKRRVGGLFVYLYLFICFLLLRDGMLASYCFVLDLKNTNTHTHIQTILHTCTKGEIYTTPSIRRKLWTSRGCRSYRWFPTVIDLTTNSSPWRDGFFFLCHHNTLSMWSRARHLIVDYSISM